MKVVRECFSEEGIFKLISETREEVRQVGLLEEYSKKFEYLI